MSLVLALSDVSQRCKATSDLGAIADIGRPYGLDGSVAFDPERKKSVRRSAPTYAFGQHH
jgi:hypothetical protein